MQAEFSLVQATIEIYSMSIYNRTACLQICTLEKADSASFCNSIFLLDWREAVSETQTFICAGYIPNPALNTHAHRAFVLALAGKSVHNPKLLLSLPIEQLMLLVCKTGLVTDRLIRTSFCVNVFLFMLFHIRVEELVLIILNAF